IAAAVEKVFLGVESEDAPYVVAADPTIRRDTSRQDRAAGIVEDESTSVFFCTLVPEADKVFQQLADELERKKSGKPVLSRFGEVVEYITGVEQDPDVLDTWFSSALWPHSTLGWPA